LAGNGSFIIALLVDILESAAEGLSADESKWPALHQSILKAQYRLFKAIKPYLTA
jgi:hypothetical protein